MKAKWLLFLTLIAGSIFGCQQSKTEQQANAENATTSSNASQTEKARASLEKSVPSKERARSFPSELLHEGARYFGAPFEKEIRYRIDGGGEMITDTRTVRVVNVHDRVAKVEGIWKGKMAERVGSEVYEIEKDGIYAISIGGVPISPRTLYLPAELTKGKTWTAKYSFQSPQMGELDVESKSQVVGKEKIKVPLGTYDAIVISETGTLKGENIRLSVTSRSYFAEGIGIVQFVSTQKGEVAGQPRKIRIKFEAIPGD